MFYYKLGMKTINKRFTVLFEISVTEKRAPSVLWWPLHEMVFKVTDHNKYSRN